MDNLNKILLNGIKYNNHIKNTPKISNNTNIEMIYNTETNFSHV